jgi:hypothetical protein
MPTIARRQSGFIHGVISIAALGNIIPQVSQSTARDALRYAWHTGCGLYACFGTTPAIAGEVEPQDQDADGLIDRAVANGDEHVIKFTEACLRRHAITPPPVYLSAIDSALATIPAALIKTVQHSCASI